MSYIFANLNGPLCDVPDCEIKVSKTPRGLTRIDCGNGMIVELPGPIAMKLVSDQRVRDEIRKQQLPTHPQAA